MNNMKKETLEEAAKRLYPFNPYSIGNGIKYDEYAKERRCFIEGVKWQMERSYSQEEQLNLLNEYNEYLFTFIDKDEVGIGVEKEDVRKWFEQFKKK